MIRLKKAVWFPVALGALGVAIAGEGATLALAMRDARAAEAGLNRQHGEARALARLAPAPIPENLRALEAELARATEMLGELRTAFQGRGPMAERLRGSPPPQRSLEAFFDLVAFGDELRERARSARVQVKVEERFGFSDYAQTGPEPESIPAVFRDRQVVDYLLTALFAAHPRELISIKRERPSDVVRARDDRLGPDYFERDKFLLRRKDAALSSRAFQLTFSGDTDALRSLLNALAAVDGPIVVRTVEVEPLEPMVDGKAGRTGEERKKTEEPIRPSLLRFCITVECFEIKPAGAPVS